MEDKIPLDETALPVVVYIWAFNLFIMFKIGSIFRQSQTVFIVSIVTFVMHVMAKMTFQPVFRLFWREMGIPVPPPDFSFYEPC